MKNIVRKIGIVFSMAIFVSLSVFSEGTITVNADVDTATIEIGRQIRLHLSSVQPEDVHVQFPLFSETVSDGVEIVRREKSDTIIISKSRIEVKQDYLITAFDSGVYYMPPFPFIPDNGDTMYTNSLTIKAFTVPVDTVGKVITDIKPVLEPPFNWWRLLLQIGLGVLIALALAVVALFVIYFVRNRSALFVAADDEKLPPHVVALQGLDRIKDEKLWQKDREKEFYSDLTDVLRIYIEECFSINAMEMTSDEIIDRLKALPEANVASKELESVLKSADMVKFAKAIFSSNEDEMNMSHSYLFVNETKKQEEPVSIVEDENSIDEIDNPQEIQPLQIKEIITKAPIDHVFDFADKFVGCIIRTFRKK